MDIQRVKQKKNIVILGAGFGGIACALKLERLFRKKPSLFRDFTVIVVDKKNYHLYTPFLYEAAATSSDDVSALNMKKAVATPIEEIMEGTHIKFIQGKIANVSVEEKKVVFGDNTALAYEYLVLALGADTTYFNIPGVKEHATPLKWLENAIHIRALIRRAHDRKPMGETLNIVIGGGGPTGIEFSAEVVGYIKELNIKSKRSLRPVVTIVEGGPSILPGFDEWTVKNAAQRLARLGVSLKTGYMISGADARDVSVKSASPTEPKEEKVPYDVFVWSGGVKAVTVVVPTELTIEKRGRMDTNADMTCVRPDLQAGSARNIFAIGDNACIYDPATHKPMPGTARMAVEQGKTVARNIFADTLGQPRKPYSPPEYPYVIPLGGKYALAKIGPVRLKGVLGWIFHELVELYYLWSTTHNHWKAFMRWWKGLEIFSKND